MRNFNINHNIYHWSDVCNKRSVVFRVRLLFSRRGLKPQARCHREGIEFPGNFDN